MRKVLLALTAGFALWIPTHVAEAKTFHYTDVDKIYQRVAPFQGYRYLHANVRWMIKGQSSLPAGLHMVIHAKAGDIDVPISTHGICKFPSTDALRKENPAADILPAGHPPLNVAFDVDVSTTPAVMLDLKTYRGMVSEWTKARASVGFFERMFLPKAHGLLITFPKQASGTVRLPGSTALLHADGKQRVAISSAQLQEVGTGTIRFDPMPSEIELNLR